MKFLLFIITFFFLVPNVSAQDFDSAVGLRFGRPNSVTYKKFINESAALEGFVGYRSFFGANFVTISGAYQIHKDIAEVDNLQYYYGGGASVYFWSVDFGDSSTSLGIQGYLGLSYTLENTPINFSIDWIPTFFINGLDGFGTGFGGGYGSLAVRYVLGRKDGGSSSTSN